MSKEVTMTMTDSAYDYYMKKLGSHDQSADLGMLLYMYIEYGMGRRECERYTNPNKESNQLKIQLKEELEIQGTRFVLTNIRLKTAKGKDYKELVFRERESEDQ